MMPPARKCFWRAIGSDIKPLYYATDANGFRAAASEARVLVATERAESPGERFPVICNGARVPSEIFFTRISASCPPATP